MVLFKKKSIINDIKVERVPKVKHCIANKSAKLNERDEKRDTPLHLAVAKNPDIFTEIVAGLIEAGARLNTRNIYGQTPLHVAAAKKNDNAVELLLLDNTYVNRKDKVNGETPLHIAARKNCNAIAKLLIQARANVGKKNWEGKTPLHLACQWGAFNIVKYLLAVGASYYRRDSKGNIPLHYACLAGNRDIARELLRYNGVTMDIKNKSGNTPLHNACIKGYLDLVVLLLAEGASKAKRNKEKLRPDGIAAQKNHVGIIRHFNKDPDYSTHLSSFLKYFEQVSYNFFREQEKKYRQKNSVIDISDKDLFKNFIEREFMPYSYFEDCRALLLNSGILIINPVDSFFELFLYSTEELRAFRYTGYDSRQNCETDFN